MSKSLGITIVELVVSLVVLCILVLFAVPHLQKRLAAMEAFKAESHLRFMLSQAKQRAYLERKRLVICGSSDGQMCHAQSWSNQILVFHDNIKINRIRESEEPIIDQVFLKLKYGTLVWQGAGANNPVFHADSGLPRGANGTFKYCSYSYTEYHFHLVMSNMGNLRVVKPSVC